MNKTFCAVGAVAILISSVATAKASDISDLTTYGIYSYLAHTPSISAGGGGLFYPIVNEVRANGESDLENMVLENKKGDQIAVENMDGKLYANGNLNYQDVYSAKWADGGMSMRLPFIMQGPMNLGHINFASGSYKIDAGDKEILDAIANEVLKSNLTGIYLVGKSDSAGSDESNLALSLKRVNAAKKYLNMALEKLGVIDAVIVTEFMGEFTAKGAPNKSNLEDRRVEVMIYPVK